MRQTACHARFAALPALQSIAIATLIFGGAWSWLSGGVLLVAILLLDEIGGDYRASLADPDRAFLEGLTYAVVPISVAMTVGLLLHTASPETLIGRAASAIGLVAADGSSWIAIVGAVFSAGLLFGITASVAHELFHRTTRLDWCCAQILLSQCLYTPFAIEHVYGHHRNVGLPSDVVTVSRGVNFWRYLPTGIAGNYRGAARIEALRMRRRNLPWLSWRNRFLQGLLFQAAVAGIILPVGGVGGLAGFAASAAIAVVFIEMANYVAHYGLVRVPGRPVRARHAWNGPRFLSTSLFLNLQRHADHHCSPKQRYWDLEIPEDAPVYPFGMSLMAAMAMVPPLWFRIVGPHLETWDQELASPGERALLGAAAAQ